MKEEHVRKRLKELESEAKRIHDECLARLAEIDAERKKIVKEGFARMDQASYEEKLRKLTQKP